MGDHLRLLQPRTHTNVRELQNKNKQNKKVGNDSDLEALIKYNFSLESIGVNNFPRVNSEEKRACAKINGRTVFYGLMKI